MAQPGSFGSECVMWPQSGCWHGLHSSEDLPETGGSTSKMVHSHGWEIGAGCHKQVQLQGQGLWFLSTGFYIGPFGLPHNMVAGF